MTVAVMREPTNAPRSNIPSPDTRRNVNLTIFRSGVLQICCNSAVRMIFDRLEPDGATVGRDVTGWFTLIPIHDSNVTRRVNVSTHLRCMNYAVALELVSGIVAGPSDLDTFIAISK